MPKDWTEFDIDEILNYDEAHTGKLARFERIMRHKEVEALGQVWAGLHDVKKTLAKSTQTMAERMKVIEGQLDNAAKTQTTLQRLMLILTLVIAAATVAYTWVTWLSVEAQRDSNEIQWQALTK